MWIQSIDCQRIPPQYFYKKKTQKNYVNYLSMCLKNKKNGKENALGNRVSKKTI